MSDTQPRHILKSIGAVLAGLVFIFVASLALDQLFHALDVYPPLGQPMMETGDNLLALAYRIVIAVAGCYITAALAPRAPMTHALILGGIGFVLSVLGAISLGDMGPLWYPVLLALTALPCAWAGAALYEWRASI